MFLRKSLVRVLFVIRLTRSSPFLMSSYVSPLVSVRVVVVPSLCLRSRLRIRMKSVNRLTLTPRILTVRSPRLLATFWRTRTMRINEVGEMCTISVMGVIMFVGDA